MRDGTTSRSSNSSNSQTGRRIDGENQPQGCVDLQGEFVRQLTIVIGMLLLVGSTVTVPPAVGEASTEVRTRLIAGIKNLPAAAEDRRGYDRDLFRHWIDANADCQDTRDEVLQAESLVATRGCDIQTGKWRSYYDRIVIRDSTGFDIDHLVPLAEAWDSGARRWSTKTRQRFANDLGDPRSLVAVSASSNRSKSDQDPAEWTPQYGTCKYLRQWVAVKIRWALSVDRAEKYALLEGATDCKNTVITVRKARIGRSPSGDGGGTGGDAGDDLDPRFSYCYEANAAGYGPYYKDRDPEYHWYTDRDGDGVVCE